jgi:hypothetical protein
MRCHASAGAGAHARRVPSRRTNKLGKNLGHSLPLGSVLSTMADNRDENNEGSTQQQLDDLTTQNMSPEASKSTSSAVPGGESGYEPWYPANIPMDSSVKRFITHFFEVSDEADRNDEWVGFFQEDATVMMGNDIAKGKEGKLSPSRCHLCCVFK